VRALVGRVYGRPAALGARYSLTRGTGSGALSAGAVSARASVPLLPLVSPNAWAEITYHL